MKTLYISDLDGTLLQPDARLSEETIKDLNSFIDSGMDFSIATARTIASVAHIMKEVHLNLPIVLMNGVCLYDIKAKKYIKVATISDSSKKYLQQKLDEYQLHGFYYTVEDDVVKTYYEQLFSPSMKYFYEVRRNRYQKNFEKIINFAFLEEKPLIYVCLLNTYESLCSLYEDILKYSALNCAFYKDNYTDEWYLEIFDSNASKYHTVNFLRKYCGYEKIVCFGDNKNDIPLFEASDEKYAVGNAVTELKELADEVIGENTANGVTNFLKQSRSSL